MKDFERTPDESLLLLKISRTLGLGLNSYGATRGVWKTDRRYLCRMAPEDLQSRKGADNPVRYVW